MLIKYSGNVRLQDNINVKYCNKYRTKKTFPLTLDVNWRYSAEARLTLYNVNWT